MGEDKGEGEITRYTLRITGYFLVKGVLDVPVQARCFHGCIGSFVVG